MEGQTDAELGNQNQMDHKRELAEDEWKSWQRGQVRNTLHLVSAAAQWILLLACLIYLGVDSLRPSTVRQIPVIMGSSLLSSIPGESIEGVAVNLTALRGSLQIRNGSVMIPCDGLYLVSLKGFIFFHHLEKSLKLTLGKTDSKTSTDLWE
ncbi:TNFL4 factor, partial [Turnix velox]|nr:TNFL4 factor [Turnix velox]